MGQCEISYSGLIPHYFYLPAAKVYIDKKLKKNAVRDPDDLIGDILHQSCLSKKELYAAITELQIGGVETVSGPFLPPSHSEGASRNSLTFLQNTLNHSLTES